MHSRLIEFHEFKRLKDEFQYQKVWESEYRSQTKEMLLNQLLEQQEENYPLIQSSAKDTKQFQALINVLDEKSETPWLKQVLQTLRESAMNAYHKFTNN